MAGKKPTMRENISSRPTDKYGRKAAAEKITRQEGTTSPSGGRPALLRVAPPSKPAKAPAVKMPKAPQIIRTTVNMKSTPMGKKR
jgi:hypothetical protein